MKCQYCKNVIKDTDTFCPLCGMPQEKDLKKELLTSKPSKEKENYHKNIIKLRIFAVIIFIVTFVLSGILITINDSTIDLLILNAIFAVALFASIIGFIFRYRYLVMFTLNITSFGAFTIGSIIIFIYSITEDLFWILKYFLPFIIILILLNVFFLILNKKYQLLKIKKEQIKADITEIKEQIEVAKETHQQNKNSKK